MIVAGRKSGVGMVHAKALFAGIVLTAAVVSVGCTPTPPASTTCDASQLALTTRATGAGLGHSYFVLSIRNRSLTSCTLSGYPGAVLHDAQGASLAAQPDTSGPAPARVVLSPGASASAAFQTLSGSCAGAGQHLEQSTSLSFTPPGAGQSLDQAFTAPFCRPFVGAMQAGTNPS